MDYSEDYKFKLSESFTEKIILQFGFPNKFAFDKFAKENNINKTNNDIKKCVEAKLHEFMKNEYKKIDELFDEPNVEKFLLPYDVINLYFVCGGLNIDRLRDRYGINIRNICNELKTLHSTLLPYNRWWFIQDCGHREVYIDKLIKQIDYKLYGQPSVICPDLSMYYCGKFHTTVTKKVVDNALWKINHFSLKHGNIFQHLSKDTVCYLIKKKIISKEQLLLCKNSSGCILPTKINWKKFSKLDGISTEMFIKKLGFMKEHAVNVLINPRNKINLDTVNRGHLIKLFNTLTCNRRNRYANSELLIKIMRNQLIPDYLQKHIIREHSLRWKNILVKNVVLTDENLNYLLSSHNNVTTKQILIFQPFSLEKYKSTIVRGYTHELINNSTLSLNDLKILISDRATVYQQSHIQSILDNQECGEEFIRNRCDGKYNGYLPENNIPTCDRDYQAEHYANDGLFIKKYGMEPINYMFRVVSRNFANDLGGHQRRKYIDLIRIIIKRQNNLKLSKCMSLFTKLQNITQSSYRCNNIISYIVAYYDNIIIDVDIDKYHNAMTVTDRQVLLSMKYGGKTIKNIFHCKNVSHRVKYYYLIKGIRSQQTSPGCGMATLSTYICRYNKEIKKCILDNIIRKTRTKKYAKIILSNL